MRKGQSQYDHRTIRGNKEGPGLGAQNVVKGFKLSGLKSLGVMATLRGFAQLAQVELKDWGAEEIESVKASLGWVVCADTDMAQGKMEDAQE